MVDGVGVRVDHIDLGVPRWGKPGAWPEGRRGHGGIVMRYADEGTGRSALEMSSSSTCPTMPARRLPSTRRFCRDTETGRTHATRPSRGTTRPVRPPCLGCHPPIGRRVRGTLQHCDSSSPPPHGPGLTVDLWSSPTPGRRRCVRVLVEVAKGFRRLSWASPVRHHPPHARPLALRRSPERRCLHEQADRVR
jgi:hypothetical protein